MARSILDENQKAILSILVKNDIFSNSFYLSGGTALSEFYLQHRLSEDLDFFSPEEIDPAWLNTLSIKIAREIGAKRDIQASFNRNLVYFQVGKKVVKTEFTYYPFLQIEKPKIINGLKIDSLIDIAVNKFFTIYQKPTARHFIDLYLIMTTKNYDFEEIEGLARTKFDTVIDPIQLGSQLIKAESVADLPKTIIKIPERVWRTYFLHLAKSLKSKVS